MGKTLKEQAIIVEQRLWNHFAGPTGELNAPAGLPFMKEFLAEVDRLVALAKRSDENSGLHKHDITNSEAAVVKCPECLQPCTQEELDMFGGLCEECTTDW